MIDRDTSYSIYKNSTPKQKYFFSSKASDDLLFSIAQKYNLHKSDKNKLFAAIVGDIVLGFYKINDTVPLLKQELGLDDETAKLLGTDVLEFLAPLSDPNWQPPEEFEPIDVDEEGKINQTVATKETEIAKTSHVITNNQNEIVDRKSTRLNSSHT